MTVKQRIIHIIDDNGSCFFTGYTNNGLDQVIHT